MNILLINHFPLEGSGSGVYTHNIAISLKNAGNKVAILFPTNKNFKKYDGIEYYPVFFNTNELDFNFPCFTTHPESNMNFDNMTNEQLDKYISVFDNKLKEIKDKFKPDVIHSGHIWILSDLACKYSDNVIITSHGTDLIGHNKNNKFHKYTNNAVKLCSKIITISYENKELVDKTFPDAKGKTILMKNGYDPKIFYKENITKKEVLDHFNINNSYDNVVCFAGKLTYIKAVDVILKSAKLLNDERTCFLIAGNGELFENLNDLLNKLNLKNVFFLKNQSHEMLRKIYSISDVSLAPSRQEAFGLVAIEALACGTPVIATNIGGFPEFINEKTGILINVEDEKALALNIKKILSKEIIYNSNYIQQYALNNYNQDLMLQELINLYKKKTR